MRNYFNFRQLNGDKVLITNDFGRYAFLDHQMFRELLGPEDRMSPELQEVLRERYFLMDPLGVFSDDALHSMRAMRNYLFSGTALHIFVVTNACNLQCVYCQAQSSKNQQRGMMSVETGRKAIDIALQSPAGAMTFEFQGGEPLANFETIRAMIEYSEERKGTRQVEYTIVSNLALLTDEILDFFIDHHVSVSTSLDGPQVLHDRNRHQVDGGGSYRFIMDGMRRMRDRGIIPGAIQTTTRESLKYPREIVREYDRFGLRGVFLRPLSPLGFAKAEWERIGYSPEEFLAFYRAAFDEALQINREGRCFPEQHSTYFLRKMLCGEAANYMELRSPCGASIGQLAYYYDGNIYTCDEARMVAEAGDDAFCLGHVDTADYKTLVSSKRSRATCAASVLEAIPGCSDCVYQPYCGVCPVVNYAQDKDPFAKAAHNYRCRIYEGMLDYLFKLVEQNDEDTMRILKSWVLEENNEGCEEGKA